MSSSETGNCQLFAAIKRAWARNQIGIQDRKIGERSVSALLQVAIFGLLLERVDRRTLAFFDASTMTAEAIGAGYATERSVRACIDALVEGGQIEATLTRGRGYMIRITAAVEPGRDVQSNRTTCPISEVASGHTVQDNRTHGPEELDTRSKLLSLRSPQEDPHSNPTGDSVASLAPSPLAPSTSRSPATLPVEADPWGLAPTPSVTASPTKLRKPRAAKPVIALLTAEALTPDERAVHDAIVQDVTLVQICHNIPQLARDLLVIANGRLDVVAKVRDLGAWNRNNPSKAWTTAGGNKGLTGCVKRDASKTPFGYPSTLPTPYATPANHHHVAAPRTQHFAPPPPPRVDLKGVDGEETFLERMARTDPQAKKIIDRMAK